ncbi:hypothetical protein BB558_001696 [Smittium angustum]|uniref:AmmeMemoRadiSam system protein B n=1 Tax=Smittium angustum TaxID=133377 RepID=A0A2U1JAM7_SMIAN|nr:hypothetical protein BB558_001696 [Smittium angustum]
MSSLIRTASHAGSWYSDNPSTLRSSLRNWLDSVPDSLQNISPPKQNVPVPPSNTRAVIVPHAGYTYCGKTAAYAFKSINIEPIERIFIIGPSHSVYFEDCCLSISDEWETPFGNIHVDRKTIDELNQTGSFSEMSLEEEEDEHSLEMMVPYLYKVFSTKISSVSIVPVVVGNLDSNKERYYGELFAPYLDCPKTLFVISSDFCHWGSRFSYTFYSPVKSVEEKPSENVGYLTGGTSRSLSSKITKIDTSVPIYKSIEYLDHEAMEIISSINHTQFKSYLSKTKNTICGRHPIAILLAATEFLINEKQKPSDANSRTISQHPQNVHLAFIDYSQSSKVASQRESSVSYASGVLYVS